MVEEQIASEPKTSESVLAILGRAFDSTPEMSRATAEKILQARMPEADIQLVDDLLAKKRDRGLAVNENDLLHDYLLANSLLTLLKSQARRALGIKITA
jgi:hypothetical protein